MTCNAQDHCFSYLTSLRADRKSEVETNEAARKEGFTRAKRITCLVRTLASHANSTHAHQVDVSTCQNKQVDTTEFNVIYFDLPSKANCVEESSKPCEQAW